MKLPGLLLTFLPGWLAVSMPACELCSIYNASNANGDFGRGIVFGVAEQYIHFGTEQFNSVAITRANPDFLDSSITHLSAGYNFSPRIGVNLTVPIVANSFRRSDVRFLASGPPHLFTEQGEESGVGDVALIGRFTVLAKREMTYDFHVNVLAGVKLPTGDTARLRDEANQSSIFNSFVPPGLPHDPLEHSLSSVHQHDLALGSGSVDGIFGLTESARWRRWFFNSQVQYALRTQGESTFQYGDDLLMTAGPGRYLLLTKWGTLSVQALATYEWLGHDSLFGQKSGVTGQEAWYFGPQCNLTWGDHFGLNAGVELPVRILNHGFQNVAGYRVHGGVSWTF